MSDFALFLSLYLFCYLIHYNFNISNFGVKKFFIIKNNILSVSYNDFSHSVAKK